MLTDREDITIGCIDVTEGLHEGGGQLKKPWSLRVHVEEVTMREVRKFSTRGVPVDQTVGMSGVEIAHHIICHQKMNVRRVSIKLAKDQHSGSNAKTADLHGKNEHPSEGVVCESKLLREGDDNIWIKKSRGHHKRLEYRGCELYHDGGIYQIALPAKLRKAGCNVRSCMDPDILGTLLDVGAV
jgi:hypothetical protein